MEMISTIEVQSHRCFPCGFGWNEMPPLTLYTSILAHLAYGLSYTYLTFYIDISLEFQNYGETQLCFGNLKLTTKLYDFRITNHSSCLYSMYKSFEREFLCVTSLKEYCAYTAENLTSRKVTYKLGISST